MRYPALLFTLLLVVFQSCAPTHYRLIYREENDTQVHPELRAVQLRWQSQRVIVTSLKGNKEEINANKVWGYEEIKGHKYRLYLDQFYEVVQSQGMTIYCRHNFGEGSTDEYFFSITPNEELLYLSARNLKKAFATDECMLDLLQQLPAKSWLKTNSKGSLQLLDAYNYCQTPHSTITYKVR